MKLIHGNNQPKAHRAKSKDEAEQIICPKCGGNLFLKAVASPMRKRLKWLKRSGREILLCPVCKIEVAG